MTQSQGKLDELTFNIGLGKAPAEANARWRAKADEHTLAERAGTLDRDRAEVLIDDPTMPATAVEAPFNSSGADKGAQDKLERNTSRDGRELLAVLAVYIPAECRGLSAEANVVRRGICPGQGGGSHQSMTDPVSPSEYRR